MSTDTTHKTTVLKRSTRTKALYQFKCSCGAWGAMQARRADAVADAANHAAEVQ